MIGMVIDASAQEPLGNCNVFISNTGTGSITDKQGRFQLINIPAGKALELVVSASGYETFTFVFSSDSLPMNLNITLHRKIVQLENVIVAPVEKNGWDKWGDYL